MKLRTSRIQTLIVAHPTFRTRTVCVYTVISLHNDSVPTLVSVYDVLTGAVKKKLKGQRACVRDVSWHPFEDKIVSTSVSYTTRTRSVL